MDRLRALVYGCLLLLIIGWLLYIGQTIFIPAVLGAVIVYVIVGLAHASGRLPGLGRRLPLQLRYLISIAVIGLVFFLLAYLVMANRERAMELAGQIAACGPLAVRHAAIRTQATGDDFGRRHVHAADGAGHHGRSPRVRRGWFDWRSLAFGQAFLPSAAPEPNARKDRQQDDQDLHVLRPRMTSRTNLEPA